MTQICLILSLIVIAVTGFGIWLTSPKTNTVYRAMAFPKEWEEILLHESVSKWGEFIVAKFLGFDLINQYEKVLFLDADMKILSRCEKALSYKYVPASSLVSSLLDVSKT